MSAILQDIRFDSESTRPPLTGYTHLTVSGRYEGWRQDMYGRELTVHFAISDGWYRSNNASLVQQIMLERILSHATALDTLEVNDANVWMNIFDFMDWKRKPLEAAKINWLREGF